MACLSASSVSLDEIRRDSNLEGDALDTEIISSHFHEVSHCLSEWRSVALKLSSFDESEIEAIESDNRKEDSKRMCFLKQLKQKLSFRATYRLLAEKLLEIGRVEDTRKLCQVCSNFSSCKHSPNIAQKSKENTSLKNRDLILQRKFEDLVESIQKSLIDRGVICSTIHSSLQFISEAEKKQLRSQPDTRSSIFEAKSITYLFYTFSDIWDYLHPGLLDFIVNRFGTKDDKDKMEKYFQTLEDFRHNVKIGEYIQMMFSISSSSSILNKHLTTVMDEGWEDKTLQDMEDYRLAMVNEIGCERFLLKALPKRSSIAIVFSMPAWISLNLMELRPLFCFYQSEKVFLNEDYIYDCTTIVVHIPNLSNNLSIPINDVMRLFCDLSETISKSDIEAIIQNCSLPFPVEEPDSLKFLFHLCTQSGELNLTRLYDLFISLSMQELELAMERFFFKMNENSFLNNQSFHESKNFGEAPCRSKEQKDQKNDVEESPLPPSESIDHPTNHDARVMQENDATDIAIKEYFSFIYGDNTQEEEDASSNGIFQHCYESTINPVDNHMLIEMGSLFSNIYVVDSINLS